MATHQIFCNGALLGARPKLPDFDVSLITGSKASQLTSASTPTDVPHRGGNIRKHGDGDNKPIQPKPITSPDPNDSKG